MARKKTHTCYVLETVQLRPKKKRHQLLHAGNSTNETDKKKDKQLLRTRNSILIPRVVDSLVYFFKYAPLVLGLDNSSCEPDEYTAFDVFQTPPNNARDTMHCTSCWAFIHRLRSL